MRLALPLALCLAACTSAPPADTSDAGDAAPEAAADAADAAVQGDVVTAPLYPRCEETGDMDDPPHAASTLVGRIVPMVPGVTRGDPVLSPNTELGERSYRMMNYDRYTMGPGESRVRRNDLGGVAPADGAARHSLAWFVHLSDFQLVDDESPSRACLADSPTIQGGARPQEAMLGRAVSAFNRTLASLERPERPYDFGIITGDCADSAQRNELRWVIQIMDGARGVRIDSGDLDDLVPGADNDPKDPFDAVAFPAPWLYVAGNHDLEVVGNFTPSAASREAAVGGRSTLGTRSYLRRWGAITTGEVTPDAERALVDRAEIVRALREQSAATPGPAGHGFPMNADVSLGANYAYDAVPGLLRVLSLDTSDPAGGSDGTVKRATVERWLVPELDRAVRDGVLVMLASHHATTAIDNFLGISTSEVDPEAVTARELEQTVARYPCVIAWLVGHEHKHRVRAIHGADGDHPGYWEVETGAVADWPAQVRAMEVVDNGNGTLSILGTLIDYEARTCMERRYRRLALLDFQSGWGIESPATGQDRNVELVIPVPMSALARVMMATARAPTRVESDTTLRGM